MSDLHAPHRLLPVAKETLIDQFWEGQINEKGFVEQGLRLGITLEQLGEIIAEIRNEDGT